MSDLMQSYAIAYITTHGPQSLTDPHFTRLYDPGLLKELQDYVNSPGYKQLEIDENQKNRRKV